MNNFFDFSQILQKVSDAIEGLGNYVNSYIAELHGVRLAAIILLLIAVVMAFTLAVVWYIKTIVVSIKDSKEKEYRIKSKINYQLDKNLFADKLDANDDEEENVDSTTNITDNSEQISSQNNVVFTKYSAPLDFDWKKGNKQVEKSKDTSVTPDIFQYQLKPHKLLSMMGLIVNMIERGVDEAKIAQTVMHKNQHLNTEDEVIQTVTTVKMFIHLCISNYFNNDDSKVVLPQADAALFHLGNEDVSLALVLLENLVNKNIDKLKITVNPQEREALFAETSNFATIWGNMASFYKDSLATKIFELAIELNPKNTTAWGRLGDTLAKSQLFANAVWAYKNVLNIADVGIHTQQTANAKKMLAICYKESGSRENTDKLFADSATFYNSIKINLPLTDKEIYAMDLIESNTNEYMEAIIERLFNSKSIKQCINFV